MKHFKYLSRKETMQLKATQYETSLNETLSLIEKIGPSNHLINLASYYEKRWNEYQNKADQYEK